MNTQSSPLSGKHIVNTRAVHQANAFDKLLHAQGAIPVSYPCIAVAPPEDIHALDTALRSPFDLLVMTSANTVRIMAQRLQALGLSFRGVSAAAVGAATAEAAREQLGIEALTIPDEYSADNLADVLPISKGTRILLPQSAIARPTLRDRLSARGAEVIAASAYRTVCGSGGVDLLPLLRDQKVDVVTFTSSSTVRCFSKRLRKEGGELEILAQVTVACIGDQTRKTAESHHLTVAVTPETHTLEGLVTALSEYYQE